MEKLFTYDRHGNAVSFEWDGDNETKDRKNWFSCISEMRGVYNTIELATLAGEGSKPKWVSTGTDGMGYWS